MYKGIDGNLLDSFYFQERVFYNVPDFGKFENRDGFFFAGDKTISTPEELDALIEVSNQIGQDLEDKYGEEIESLFFLNLEKKSKCCFTVIASPIPGISLTLSYASCLACLLAP